MQLHIDSYTTALSLLYVVGLIFVGYLYGKVRVLMSYTTRHDALLFMTIRRQGMHEHALERLLNIKFPPETGPSVEANKDHLS